MSGANDLRALSDELRLDSQNPWPGLTAFTERQHAFFYGRDQESHELFSCVKRERLTVLFGKSGLGKTSLLQAGLFPQLRDADYLPVYVRLSYEDGAPRFDTQLRTALESAIQLADFAEVAFPQQGESVWEYLHRRGGNLIDDDGNVVLPVLIFDQFEEYFTLGARKDFAPRLTTEFLPGLAEMIENRPPSALTRKLTEDRDLSKRYDLESTGCRILITLREDYLANLEALRDSMPSLVYIDNRMRLTEMTGEQALSVVLDPSPGLVDPGVAESIVRFVAGAHTDSADGDVRTIDNLSLKHLEVAPAILSLFCRQLNEERLKSFSMSKITGALVLSQGVTIIEDFYKKCIADMHPGVRRLIEDRLLTTAGYRDNIDLAEARANLHRAGADPNHIDDLVRLRLLQIEDHRGVPRLELTHDVLAEPVKHSRDDWKKAQQQEAVQQQEREALLQAKQAEQEALKRTRFLQKMVAAAVAVCLLMAMLIGVLAYTYHERESAMQDERIALQKEKLAEHDKLVAEQNRQAALTSKHLADLKAQKAEQVVAKITTSELASTRSALLSAQQELKMKSNLFKLSSGVLDHCVSNYSKFSSAADSQLNDVGKDSVRLLYEKFLMEPGQCLDLAEQAHEANPDSVEVSDDLTMIPIQAAASAAQRHSNPDSIRREIQHDFSQERGLSVFRGDRRDAAQIMLARGDFAFAWIFSEIHDDSAMASAQEGMNLLKAIRTPANSNAWSYQVWNLLGKADDWHGIYDLSKGSKDSPTAPVDSFRDAFNDARRAADLAPKGDSYYLSQELERSTKLADTEKDMGNRDNDAIADYQTSLGLAERLNDEESMTEIYTDERVLLVRQKRYDDAATLANRRIHSLSAAAEDTQRDRHLAQAYRDAAEVEEDQKNWQPAVTFRASALEVVNKISPADYVDQPTDLAYAYSLLSWDMIFSGNVDGGIRDAHTAITVSAKSHDQAALYASFENVTNALIQNKKYNQAETLLGQFSMVLEAAPPSTERERELATVVDAARVRISQGTNNLQKAAEYRADEVKRLALLKPDAYTALQTDLISAYGNLSFEEDLAGNFAVGLGAAKAALKLDPSQSWIEENEADSLLLSGHPDDAKALYMKVKDVEWEGAPISNAISNDMLTFCGLGYARPEMENIARALGITTSALYKCLENPPTRSKAP